MGHIKIIMYEMLYVTSDLSVTSPVFLSVSQTSMFSHVKFEGRMKKVDHE
jgi:hypothetical protein